MTPTTGMLMYGNISVGMVTIEIPPRIAIKSAITMKVYGRRSASLTIHIFAIRSEALGWPLDLRRKLGVIRAESDVLATPAPTYRRASAMAAARCEPVVVPKCVWLVLRNLHCAVAFAC